MAMVAALPVARPLQLTAAQDGAVVQVMPGQDIQVRLPDPSPAGPDWALAKGPPVVVVTGRGYEPEARRPGVFGGSGLDVIVLKVAGRPGQTAPLSFAYRLSNTRMAFAHVWGVRLRVVSPSGAASQPSPMR